MLPAWCALLLLLAACWLTGYVLHRYLPADDLDGVAGTFAEVALGVSAIGWLALLLVEVGWLRLSLLALLIGAAVALLAWRAPWRAARPAASGADNRWPLALLALWAAAAGWLFLRPHEFIRGAADAGVYVNLAVEIARSGALLIDDPTLAALDPALYPHLLRPSASWEAAPYTLLPGFFVEDPAGGRVIPQFYALHPVWQALAVALSGVEGALLIIGAWALLATLAVWLLARDLGGRYAPWIVLAGLTGNALQIWFARYPTTEALTQYLLWCGLWALGRWLTTEAAGRRSAPLYPLLAGVLLGQALLTRIDLFFLLALPPALALWRWLRPDGAPGVWRRWTWFAAPLLLLGAHSFAHAWWLSRPYFLNTFRSQLTALGSGWWRLAISALAVLALIALLGRRPAWRAALWAFALRWLPTAQAIAAVGLLLLAAYAWFIRPLGTPIVYDDFYGGVQQTLYDHENLIRLGWYLSPFGVWLGALGAAWLTWRLRAAHGVLLALGVGFTLLYVWQLRATPNQIYAMRRFVPVTLPFLILAAGLLLDRLLTRPRHWQQAVGALLLALWLAGFGWLARGFVSQVDEVGLGDQIAALSATLEPHSILLFGDPLTISQGDLIGTTLRFQHGHDVFTLRNRETLDPAVLAAQIARWQAAGRSVYWLQAAHPQPVAWPLADDDLVDARPYRLATTGLESINERRPQRVIDIVYAGTLGRVPPLTRR